MGLVSCESPELVVLAADSAISYWLHSGWLAVLGLVRSALMVDRVHEWPLSSWAALANGRLRPREYAVQRERCYSTHRRSLAPGGDMVSRETVIGEAADGGDAGREADTEPKA